MSDLSSLSELARFVGSASLDTEGASARNRAVNDVNWRSGRQPSRQRVSDLLAVVLTLSARTRRVVLPKVEIDLDVFAPGGQRAVRMRLPV